MFSLEPSFEYLKCLTPLYKIGMSRIKPNNPIIGNTLPMSEIKPINVQMNVTIVMTIISTKYCFENGVVKREANAYIKPTIVL